MRFWWLPFSFGPAKVPGISASELNALLKSEEKGKRVFLVDVRRPAEYKQSHIKGAVNVPIGSLSGAEVVKMVEEFARERECDKKNVEVVCICLSAHRSPPAVRLIKDADPSLDVKQLDYGMANWWLKKFECVSEET